MNRRTKFDTTELISLDAVLHHGLIVACLGLTLYPPYWPRMICVISNPLDISFDVFDEYTSTSKDVMMPLAVIIA